MTTIAAIFDVDRTLIRWPTERLFFAFLVWRGIISPARAWTFGKALLLDRTARYTNKGYLRDLEASRLELLAQECYQRLIRPRLSPVGRCCLEDHQQQGHQIILLTGSLECLMLPLHLDLHSHWLIATRLQTRRGRYTGAITGLHPRGEQKLRLVEELSQKAGFELSQSFAYADHSTDLPLLEKVGWPVAVNPCRRLRRTARENGWPVRRF